MFASKIFWSYPTIGSTTWLTYSAIFDITTVELTFSGAAGFFGAGALGAAAGLGAGLGAGAGAGAGAASAGAGGAAGAAGAAGLADGTLTTLGAFAGLAAAFFEATFLSSGSGLLPFSSA